MGHFSVACAISGTSIKEGDPCCFLPLTVDANNTNLDNMSPIIVSNSGASVFFKPYALPMFGEYSGYGKMENITEDPVYLKFAKFHKNILNDMFTFKKQDRISLRYSIEKKALEEIELAITGCFISTPIWKAALKYEMTTKNYGCSVLHTIHITESMLVFAGFKKIEQLDRNKNRFYLVYQKPDFPEIVANCDGTFTHITGADGIYTFYELQKYCISKFNKPIFNKMEIKSLQSKNSNCLYIKDKLEVTKRLLEFGISFGFDGVLGTSIMPDFYVPDFLDESSEFSKYKDTFIEKMAELSSIRHFMYRNNRFLFPSFSGPQDGDMDAENYLAKTILKQNASKLKKEQY